MKVPDALFGIINGAMRQLLRSPLHRLVSGSIMLITYHGRRSGREFSTPVRYIPNGSGVRCFSDQTTQWWRNLRARPEVTLLIAGVERRYRANVYVDDPLHIRAALIAYLKQFPQDAAYHHIRLDGRREPNPQDLDNAALKAVMVELQPLD